MWSAQDGRLIKTFRMPNGKGHGGKAYSVALSPDGRYLAVGGWDAQYEDDQRRRIYLFDKLTGKVVRRIGKFLNVIHHIAFSNDGQFMAATLGGVQGMRVWRTSDWKEIASDKKDYKGDSYGGTFGPDNSFYTTSFDGHIRKYSGPNFKLTAKVPGNHQKSPLASL